MIDPQLCRIWESMNIGPLWVERSTEEELARAREDAAAANTAAAPAGAGTAQAARPVNAAAAVPATTATASTTTTRTNIPAAEPPALRATDAFTAAVPAPDPREQARRRAELEKAMEKELPDPIEPEAYDDLDWEACRAKLEEELSIMRPDYKGKPLFGAGEPGSGVLVVAQMPNNGDLMEMRPLTGPQGELFSNMMKAIGLDRDKDLFVTHLIKYRTLDAEHLDKRAKLCALHLLTRQIELLRPKAVLALGLTVSRALVPGNLKTGLDEMRAEVRSYESNGVKVPVVCTFSLEYLLRCPKRKRDAWADLIRFKELL